MVTVDMRQVKRLEGDLKTFAERAYPFATKNTINQGAFHARSEWQENIRDEMTLRNKFTERSIRVEQSRTLDVRRQSATVGSIAPYMPDQEFGAVKSSKGKEGTPIATSFAAGQGEGAERTRLVRKPNKLATIRLQKRGGRGASRKQRNAAAVTEAVATKRRYIFMDLGRRKGIFKVTGGKRKPRVRMVWDLTRQSVIIPKTPTLGPAVRKTERVMPDLYLKSLEFQAKRHGLFPG